MSSDQHRKPDQANDEVRLEDLPARSADKSEGAAVKRGGALGTPSRPVPTVDDDVIRIEDLTPRENVKGGRKVILGEVATRPEEKK
jgi:hypothetical protein